MRGKLKLFWAGGARRIVNYGDALSKPVLERLTGRPIVFAKPATADIAAAGSIFKSFMSTRWRRPFRGRFDPLVVWGSGSLASDSLARTNYGAQWVEIRAVRGPRTRREIGAPEDLPLGDPGLLAPLLLDERTPTKAYAIGFVPHKDDRYFSGLHDLVAQHRHAIAIDLTNPDLIEVTKTIARCDLIVSSSLHGVIVADALGVPNVFAQRVASKRAPEDVEFKFQDYFESIGRPCVVPIRLEDALDPKLLEQNAQLAAPERVAKISTELVSLIADFS
ncbi:MAG: polysaccharide pyruvyl transferase family protein [Neomegalonema sp.]|nr:polysaccharide pyruvyl transferase family protein [Neomegalonema sp.]